MSFKVVDTAPEILFVESLTYTESSLDLDCFLYWSNIALEASGRDHISVKEQAGPCRASRALAIIHLAMFEAYNAIDRRYTPYLDNIDPNSYASPQSAVAQAAHDTIVALFPTQTALHNTLLTTYLSNIASSSLKTNGITLGCLCASQALLLRINDGSAHSERMIGVDYFPSGAIGEWDSDPVTPNTVALGSLWPTVKPFVLTTASQFRPPAFPLLTSVQYADELNEVKSLGQDTSITRTADQTEIGIYWGYDGAPILGAPPNLFCQIISKIAIEQSLKTHEVARLLALLTIGMADAGISCWEAKYFYKIWRPTSAIRNAHLDGNAGTVVDPAWVPLGAPASNRIAPNFVPPFPAYSSGHATFGGTVFQIARRFFGTDYVPFSFISHEFDGVTTDNTGVVRPIRERSFFSFSQAEMENALSRIYLGVHFRSDCIQGIAQGNNIGNYVFDNVLQPL